MPPTYRPRLTTRGCDIIDLGCGAVRLSDAAALADQAVHSRPTRTRPQEDKEAERDFELAVAPVRTLCCAHLFCAEHISSWLHGPTSGARCPRVAHPPPLLASGHPATALLHLAPSAPPPSRAPAPVLFLPVAVALLLFILLILPNPLILLHLFVLQLEILPSLPLHARPCLLSSQDSPPPWEKKRLLPPRAHPRPRAPNAPARPALVLEQGA
ncbi:hypothetical protein B0H19DRAFT_1378859 [Mycena capillaripes]|nr:hypothetical protein B0H19DRAFT_1378859 [Mycena capillaripes]